VPQGLDPLRPLHRIEVGDAAGTELYVSSRNGEVVRDTTRSERLWNWLGSVPHWIYPTVLRQNPPLWSQVVIWTSLVGTFLAVTGIYLGIRQFGRQRDGRWASPYRGFLYWHHVPGLIFGVFALSWVFSGLLSMNPWGLLETQGISEDMDALSGERPRWTDDAVLEPSYLVEVIGGPDDGHGGWGGLTAAVLHVVAYGEDQPAVGKQFLRNRVGDRSLGAQRVGETEIPVCDEPRCVGEFGLHGMGTGGRVDGLPLPQVERRIGGQTNAGDAGDESRRLRHRHPT